MNGKGLFGTVCILVVALVLSSSLFTIKEYEKGILLRFGEVVNPNLEPGLDIKIPIVHEVRRFDARILSLDIPVETYRTKNKEPLIVDAYTIWKISDLRTFYTSTNSGDMSVARQRLATLVSGKLRDEFGSRTVDQVVSSDRESLLKDLITDLDSHVNKEFGMSVLDVRVKQIERPDSAIEAVYSEMRAERERKAQEYRSKGRELSDGIKANASREAREIEAEAERDSQVTRGEGEALAARVYAEAFNEDAEFFEFYRSLQAYQASFSNSSDLLVLSPKSEFFDYMKDSEAKK